jgi:hypothetical protein
MNKETLKGFLRFLDSANLEELRTRRSQMQVGLDTGKFSAELKSEIRYGIRLLDQEMVARLSLTAKQSTQRKVR